MADHRAAARQPGAARRGRHDRHRRAVRRRHRRARRRAGRRDRGAGAGVWAGAVQPGISGHRVAAAIDAVGGAVRCGGLARPGRLFPVAAAERAWRQRRAGAVRHSGSDGGGLARPARVSAAGDGETALLVGRVSRAAAARNLLRRPRGVSRDPVRDRDRRRAAPGLDGARRVAAVSAAGRRRAGRSRRRPARGRGAASGALPGGPIGADPALARREHGVQLLDAAADDVAELLREFAAAE